jgi:hypothetical protein
MNRIPFLCCLIVLAGMMLAGCGGGDSKQAVTDEHDGAELTALMQNAHRAIKDSDEAAFDSLFFFRLSKRTKYGKESKKQKIGGGRFVLLNSLRHRS